jgi:hypothetical protein
LFFYKALGATTVKVPASKAKGIMKLLNVYTKADRQFSVIRITMLVFNIYFVDYVIHKAAVIS